MKIETPEKIYYSDGHVVLAPVVQIWDDLHTEARGNWYRAFWCASSVADTGYPVIGYCSPGGSHRTIKAAAQEVRRIYSGAKIYRNGKEVRL